jgi:hypothetical protein
MILGLRQIKIKELPTWIKVLKNSPDIETKEDMLAELILIDDLLEFQACKSLLTRKRGLKDQLEARIGLELGYKPANMNVK